MSPLTAIAFRSAAGRDRRGGAALRPRNQRPPCPGGRTLAEVVMWKTPSPPILVLGLGNTLLGDDALGVELVGELEREISDPGVEFLDGGTQGMALLGHLAERREIIVLDAVALGHPPGTLHILSRGEVLGLGAASSTAHDGNAGELLRASLLLGDLPERVAVIGIEPARVRTGIGLSGEVRRAVPAALEAARASLAEALGRLAVGAPPPDRLTLE